MAHAFGLPGYGLLDDHPEHYRGGEAQGVPALLLAGRMGGNAMDGEGGLTT